MNDFVAAVRKVPGLEWLISFEPSETDTNTEGENPSSDEDDDAILGLTNRIYALATNANALKELLRLWDRYKRGQKLEYGFGGWNQVFSHLRDVRPWSVQDRLHETGVVDFWREALEAGLPSITFAVEFWFRENPDVRQRAFNSLRAVAESLGGTLSHRYEHVPTAFHAAIATLPPEAVRQFLENQDAATFLQRTEVMFCRPQGQTAAPLTDEDGVGEVNALADPPTKPPIAALLDGLPIENHSAYAGWLQVDDPDGWAGMYEAIDRQHGTGMTSLIVRGDLNLNDAPLASQLYVRPILKPDPSDFYRPRAERMPEERFPQDLLEAAVRRFKVGTADTPAVAPTVRVVNLSIGDPSRVFDGSMTPWARMVDYLAWKYNLLFIVSAGNHASIQSGKTLTEWEALAAAEKESVILQACWDDVRHRRLLSPAETINAVTVAAQHVDESGPVPPLGALGCVPIQNSSLASATSAIGPGYRRAVKPDLALPGGQQVMTFQPNGNLKAAGFSRAPGQLVAVPGRSGTQNSKGYTCGTSNAAALATRQAVAIIEVLHDLQSDDGEIPEEFLPVLTKALLAHAASAADAASRLREIFDVNNNTRVDLFRKRHVISTVGYGSIEPGRATGAEDHRATLIGWGKLLKERAHEFRFSLPASLNAVRGKRRLTFTLAWFSPINSQSKAYRCARLWLSPPTEKLATNRAEAEWRSVRNGTLQHEIWEGESASAFAQGAELVVRVNCREDAGRLNEEVRYGLAVSIEAAVSLGLPIYEEVRQGIPVREPVIPAR